jgi:ABC-2 type transport system permease protein
MKAMKGMLTAFFSVMKTVIAARMSYRADFFISAVIVMAAEMTLPLVTFLIYRSGASFPGWTMEEALLIQAVFMLSKGIAYPLFFGMVWNTLDRVREGTFDILLLKPRSALFMTMVTGFNTEGLGRLVGGMAFFTAVVMSLPAPEFAEWLHFGWMMVLSLAVLFSFVLWMSGILFVWVGSSRVQEIFDSVSTFGMYPKSIFTRSFQSLVTYIIPVGAIGFMPASVLLDRNEGIVASSLVCGLFLAVSVWFWHAMLGKYTSAGG